MIRKIEYEIKTDKRGRTYANRINLKTGKRKHVKVKTARKRIADQKYREKKSLRSRIRFNWRYWEMPTCNTPVFIAYGHAENGDHYKSMKKIANEILEDIHRSNLCPNTEILGGACVILYKKKTKQILKMHELGEGCVKGVERGM